MRIGSVAAAFLATLLSIAGADQSSAQTQQELMKTCADEWNSLKAANKTAGMVYQDFVRECLAKHRAAKPDATAGTVNLNTATAAELDRLPQIDEAHAKAIIEARAKGQIQELGRLRGAQGGAAERRNRHQGACELLIQVWRSPALRSGAREAVWRRVHPPFVTNSHYRTTTCVVRQAVPTDLPTIWPQKDRHPRAAVTSNLGQSQSQVLQLRSRVVWR
jgi:DNA uptake protein ComE-like DNA-binding protein